MARNTAARCRICRGQKQKLMLKGDRCISIKCPIDKKNSTLRKGLPGKMPGMRLKKTSNYGIQLKEKQKLKNIYGILERQFRRLFAIANRKKGITGENLIQLLELRLDNVVFRMKFLSSRNQARQFILHGHIAVNGKTINIPSYIVKKDDVIEVKEKSKKLKIVLDSLKKFGTEGVASWIDVNPDEVKGVIRELPKRADVKGLEQVNEQLVVELYSK